MGTLLSAALLAVAFVPAVGVGGAAAVSADLYVDNAAMAHCSDGGQGSQEQPYCTVSAAAKVVQPGQTVHIAKGTYPEQVTLTRSGTDTAPITFEGQGDTQTAPMGRTFIGGGSPLLPHAFVFSSVRHVRVTGLAVTTAGEGFLIDGGSDDTVNRTSQTGGGPLPAVIPPAIRVTGGATGVKITQNHEMTAGGFVRLDPGVQDSVISTNDIMTSTGTSLVADGAVGTDIVSNTISSTCHDSISLTGASTGTVIENNVVSTSDANSHYSRPCDQAASLAGLRVDAAATAGTKVGYNVFDYRDGSPAYNWAGTAYADSSAFNTATGQGDRDLVGNTELSTLTGDSGGASSPLIDSADENAPGMLDSDAVGEHAVDDPWVVEKSGTGTGYRDRGAYEQTNFGAYYTPVGPVRVLDTRRSPAGAVPAGGYVDLMLAGSYGLPLTGVTALTMNVTVTEGTAPGFLTAFPRGVDRPLASSLNWTAGQTVPNLVTVQMKGDTVTLYNGSRGSVHLVADLLGYYSTTGSGYHAAAPVRLLDTRNVAGAPSGPLGPGSSFDLQLAGEAGIPDQGVTAVTVNMTVTQPTAPGYLTVYPRGGERPVASSLNWTAGQTVANLVTVPVKDGHAVLYNGSSGTVQVVADLAGYFTAGSGAEYHALPTRRVLDTRSPSSVGDGQQPRPMDPGMVWYLGAGMPGVAADALNVTVTNGTAPGYLTVYPGSSPRPLASNLNWTAGQTVPNAAVTAVDQADDIAFSNGSSGPVDLVVDLLGYYQD